MSDEYLANVRREYAAMSDARLNALLCEGLHRPGVAGRILADAGLSNLSAEQFDAAHAEMDESDIGDRWEGQQ